MDKQIKELEAELEIARLEAKLMKLRNAKAKRKSQAPPPNFGGQDMGAGYSGGVHVDSESEADGGNKSNNNSF